MKTKTYKGVKLHPTNEIINERIKIAMDNSEGRMSKSPYNSGFVNTKYIN